MLSISIGYNMIQPSRILPPFTTHHRIAKVTQLGSCTISRNFSRRVAGAGAAAASRASRKRARSTEDWLRALPQKKSLEAVKPGRWNTECAGKMSSRLSSCQNLQRFLSLMASSLIFTTRLMVSMLTLIASWARSF